MSFLFVGRLDELKGVKILFNAWKMMGHTGPGLDVCGIGPLEDWCITFKEENGLTNINMRGKIDNSAVKEKMADCDALILPTLLYEGFPMTIAEAYSVGCPVIGSRQGNVGCLIENGITGLTFDIKSINDLINCIRKIRKFNMDRSIIKEYYAKYYSSEINYKILNDIYSYVKNKE